MMNIVKIIRLTEENCDVLLPASREASPDIRMQLPKSAAVRFSPERIRVAVAFCHLSWRRLRDANFDYSPAAVLRTFAYNKGGGVHLPLYNPL